MNFLYSASVGLVWGFFWSWQTNGIPDMNFESEKFHISLTAPPMLPVRCKYGNVVAQDKTENN